MSLPHSTFSSAVSSTTAPVPAVPRFPPMPPGLTPAQQFSLQMAASLQHHHHQAQLEHHQRALAFAAQAYHSSVREKLNSSSSSNEETPVSKTSQYKKVNIKKSFSSLKFRQIVLRLYNNICLHSR